jgi:hypothetical protein
MCFAKERRCFWSWDMIHGGVSVLLRDSEGRAMNEYAARTSRAIPNRTTCDQIAVSALFAAVFVGLFPAFCDYGSIRLGVFPSLKKENLRSCILHRPSIDDLGFE